MHAMRCTRMTEKAVVANMQDLMALDCIPGLIRAGVSCLKIEGRLKGPEYVAVTTQAYRQAVDAAWDQVMQQATGPHASSQGPAPLVTDQQRKALHQVCCACGGTPQQARPHKSILCRFAAPHITILLPIPYLPW